MIFTYNSSVLVGSAFEAVWEDSEGGFIKFAVKRDLKQDQTLHMERKLHVILYFREEWQKKLIRAISHIFLIRLYSTVHEGIAWYSLVLMNVP